MKLFLIAAIFAILLTACTKKEPSQATKNSAFSQNPNTTIPQEQKEINASFTIFINDGLRVFTASMYHNLSPNVYIKKDKPNIVVVTKNGTTWQDFFNTLPMKLTVECITTGTGETFCTTGTKKLKFYLNGKLERNLLGTEIKNGDKVLITFGYETDAQIQNQLKLIP